MRNRIVKIAAWVVAGRLERAGVSPKHLRKLKRELTGFDATRGTWKLEKSTTEKSETKGEPDHASDKPEVRT